MVCTDSEEAYYLPSWNGFSKSCECLSMMDQRAHMDCHANSCQLYCSQLSGHQYRFMPWQVCPAHPWQCAGGQGANSILCWLVNTGLVKVLPHIYLKAIFLGAHADVWDYKYMLILEKGQCRRHYWKDNWVFAKLQNISLVRVCTKTSDQEDVAWYLFLDGIFRHIWLNAWQDYGYDLVVFHRKFCGTRTKHAIPIFNKM